MSLDPYEGFAERYDRFHATFGAHAPEITNFFRELFAKHQVRSVLDCACGTGQHLPLFHSLQVEIVGSDISEAMLAQAQKNLTSYGLAVPLHKVDFRELSHHFNRPFDAVIPGLEAMTTTTPITTSRSPEDAGP